jgi:predicted small metal-binding protein
MAKTVSCRDVGIDCDFVAKGETNEDIMQQAAEHARTAHNMTEIPHQRSQKKFGVPSAMRPPSHSWRIRGLPLSRINQRPAPARLFPSTPGTAASFRGTTSPTEYFLGGRLFLDVETSLEVRAVINGDAVGRDVAHDNGRLL